MSFSLSFTFHAFERDTNEMTINMNKMGDVTVSAEKYYKSISTDITGTRVLHIEFTASNNDDREKLNALIASNNVPCMLVSFYLNGDKFNGIIKRAKLSKEISVFAEPEGLSNRMFKINSLHVVLLISEINEEIWQKLVG